MSKNLLLFATLVLGFAQYASAQTVQIIPPGSSVMVNVLGIAGQQSVQYFCPGQSQPSTPAYDPSLPDCVIIPNYSRITYGDNTDYHPEYNDPVQFANRAKEMQRSGLCGKITSAARP